MGLFLPLRTAATSDARRPNVYAEASTTYHFLSMVDGLAIKVFIGLTSLDFTFQIFVLFTGFYLQGRCRIPGLWYPWSAINRHSHGRNRSVTAFILYYTIRGVSTVFSRFSNNKFPVFLRFMPPEHKVRRQSRAPRLRPGRPASQFVRSFASAPYPCTDGSPYTPAFRSPVLPGTRTNRSSRWYFVPAAEAFPHGRWI